VRDASPSRPLPSSRIPATLAEVLNEHFPIGLGRRHSADKLYDFVGELPIPLSRQYLAGLPPPPLYVFPGVHQRLHTRIGLELASIDLADFLHLRSNPSGFPSLLGPIDPIELR